MTEDMQKMAHTYARAHLRIEHMRWAWIALSRFCCFVAYTTKKINYTINSQGLWYYYVYKNIQQGSWVARSWVERYHTFIFQGNTTIYLKHGSFFFSSYFSFSEIMRGCCTLSSAVPPRPHLPSEILKTL